MILQQLPGSVPVVVFVTADDRYLGRTLEIGAADYVLKPFFDEPFEKALIRALRAVSPTRAPTTRETRACPSLAAGLTAEETLRPRSSATNDAQWGLIRVNRPHVSVPRTSLASRLALLAVL